MSILDTAKDVYELAKKGATLELQEQLVKLREEALRLQEENLGLRESNKALEQAFEVKEALEFDGTTYWVRDSQTNEKVGPYCQRCYDVDQQLVRLQSHHIRQQGAVRRWWQCTACKTSFDP